MQQRLSKRSNISIEDAEDRIKRVLEAAGVKATISACNCCCQFDVEFPNGDVMETDEGISIVCDGLSHQRG